MHQYAILSLAMILGACATNNGGAREFLDPSTSATITKVDTSMIFYQNNSARAAHSRNFVNLAPIEVNKSGQYRYYIWLGIWSTDTDPDAVRDRDSFESVTLFVDGQPIPLNLTGWTHTSVGASVPIYQRPIASANDGYYEVTLDQLRLLAQASDVSMRVGETSSTYFETWDKQATAFADLRAFIRATL